MIKVSKLADYATVIMAYMARDYKRVYNARDIAMTTHIALPTVSKVLKQMARFGLLGSQRGAKGGYYLTRKPEEITVVQIIKAMDGNFGVTDCSYASGACTLEPTCAIRSNWRLLNNVIYKALDGITLADMLHPMPSQSIPS